MTKKAISLSLYTMHTYLLLGFISLDSMALDIKVF